MNINEKIINNLTTRIQNVKVRINQLNKYARIYGSINIILVTILAATTTSLGYLESISLGIEVTDGTASDRTAFSAIKLTLIVIGTILTTVLTTLNPSKKSTNCHKCAKDYSGFRMELSNKLDKFNVEYYGNDSETLKKYTDFCNLMNAKEKDIMEEQTVMVNQIM